MSEVIEPESGSSVDAIENHYGTGNDYFALWLGKTMAYSCALWDDADPDQSLDDAQLAKIIHHCDESHARNAERCLLYTSPSPRDLSTSRMPSSA